MADLFADLYDWLAALPAVWAYATILSIAYVENLAPPIPGDMVVVFGGYLAGVGQLNLPTVVILSTVGGALGFMSMYGIGYRLGEALLAPDRARWLPKERIRRARGAVQRWGYGLVAANRFLSGLRSVISLAVGMSHMPPGRTAGYATLSALVWTSAIAYLGYLAGENWEAVRGYLSTYGQVIVALMVVGAVALGVRAWRRRRTGRDAS